MTQIILRLQVLLRTTLHQSNMPCTSYLIAKLLCICESLYYFEKQNKKMQFHQTKVVNSYLAHKKIPLKISLLTVMFGNRKGARGGELVSTDTCEKNTTPCGSKRIRGPKLENFGVRSNWVGPRCHRQAYTENPQIEKKNTIKKKTFSNSSRNTPFQIA